MTLPLLLAFALSPPDSTQEVIPLVLVGDSVPGAGQVTATHQIALNSGGDWVALVDTTGGEVVIRNGTPFLRVGDPVIVPVGQTITDIVSVDVDSHGRSITILELSGGDRGLYVNHALITRTGDVVGAPELPADATYTDFWRARVSESGPVLLAAVMEGQQIEHGLMVLNLAGNSLASTTALAFPSLVLPGQSQPMGSLTLDLTAARIDAAGHVIFTAHVPGNFGTGSVLYRNGNLLAQEGLPSVIFGETWGGMLADVAKDVNVAGSTAFIAPLSGGGSRGWALVKDGTVVARDGDVLPDTAPQPLVSASSVLHLSDDGDPWWIGAWNDSVQGQSNGIFRNEGLVVGTGNPVGDAMIASIQPCFAVSKNGRHVLFTAMLSDGTVGLFLLGEVGTNYCIALPNSSGLPASITASGFESVYANQLILRAEPLPLGVIGVFFYGGSQPFFAFGNGFRCVGAGSAGLFRLPYENSGSAGVLRHELDFTSPPNSSGQVIAGSTWNFQAWFRDPVAGVTGFNLSDALTILFTP